MWASSAVSEVTVKSTIACLRYLSPGMPPRGLPFRDDDRLRPRVRVVARVAGTADDDQRHDHDCEGGAVERDALVASYGDVPFDRCCSRG